MWEWLFWLLVVPIVMLFGFVVFVGAPYVPTMRPELRRIFRELYPLGSGDVLVDLGSGDGVVLREAVRFGARAIGYELNPALVWFSRWKAHSKMIEAHVGNMWHVELPQETTVVYVFAVERDAKKIAQRMQEEAERLGRTVVIISHGCKLPSGVLVKSVGAHFLYEFTPLHVQKT